MADVLRQHQCMLIVDSIQAAIEEAAQADSTLPLLEATAAAVSRLATIVADL